jgi:hypothetical protein
LVLISVVALFNLTLRRHAESERIDPFENSANDDDQNGIIRNFGISYSDGGFQDFGYLDAQSERRKRSTYDASYGYQAPYYDAPIVTYWNTPWGSGYSTEYASQSGSSTSYANVDGNGMFTILFHFCVLLCNILYFACFLYLLLAVLRSTDYGASTSIPPFMSH